MFIPDHMGDYLQILTSKNRRREYSRLRLYKECSSFAQEMKNALAACSDEIPVIVISFNNGIYVRNMVEQLQGFGVVPIIIDNCSTDVATQNTVHEFEREGKAHIAFAGKNFGHLAAFLEPIYPLLPEVFAYTDPDLQLNPDLPKDFLHELARLTEHFHVYKAGFALQLLEGEEVVSAKLMRSNSTPVKYEKTYSVREWESQFWRKPLSYKNLEVWAADIDTTFAVYRKSNYYGDFYDAIRVSGNYGAVHLPWFPKRDLFSEQSRSAYSRGNISSTWL